MDELCGPYATVIDIKAEGLPIPHDVQRWDGQKYASVLRHVKGHPDYNPNFRQLIHVGYKIAAEFGSEYTDMLKKYADIVGQQVTENIYDRHIKTLFGL